jgi:hypothetical protein
MSLILAWVFFPLVLAAVGLGWGATVQWLGGRQTLGPLTIPIGLATAICLAGLLTSFNATAPIAAPITALGALLGVGFVWGRARLGAAPALAAIGVLLVYGAPVILSGEATFLGYVRLDDTATWFNLIDQLFTHGRSFAVPISSTYELNAITNLAVGSVGGIQGVAYPSGSFMLLGVGHWITRIDIAWIFQPYLACCAAALALAIYALLEPLLDWRWLRAFIAFIAAQSALLFGYAAWGGIKELTAAFLVALGVALAAQISQAQELRARMVLPLAVAGGALMVTLGPDAADYALPLVLLLAVIFIYRIAISDSLVDVLVVAATLIVATALCAVPLWLTISHYVQVDQGSFNTIQNAHTELGNLVAALRAVQIAGIWPAGDFRDVTAAGTAYAAPAWFPSHLLIYLVFASGVGAVAYTLYRRRWGLGLYVLVALAAVCIPDLLNVTPWLIGKALTISSPAVLLAGLVGGGLLFREEKTLPLVAGVVVLAAIAGGVIWSNWLQYRAVTLAPRDQLSELETIGAKVAGHGPTFINEYQIYADRHFLRSAAPVEPAEYRNPLLPTVTGAVLTDPAWADIDSFPLSTLAPYKSLVIRRSPVESRPPSSYNLVWQGRYYQLYEQPAHATHRVIEHVALGDTKLDYCGYAEYGRPAEADCSIQPAAVPACSKVKALARRAAADGGELLAYERTNPIVLRATQTSWPRAWSADTIGGSLEPTTAGTAVAHVELPTGPHRYQLWLGGSFARGFKVSVDGHYLGSVANELNNIGDYNQVGPAITLGAGVHTIAITYPALSGLAPGGADDEPGYTGLDEIALEQQGTPARMIELEPPQASQLCGHSLDWIEIVAPEHSR